MSQPIDDAMRKCDIKGVWNLNRFCNFNCEYCYTGPDRGKPEFLGTTGIDEKIKAFDATDLTWWIGLVGGEPFLHPRFVDLCEGLTRRHCISMATNLSSSLVGEFAKRIRPERVVFIHASLHYEERVRQGGLKAFFENALILARAGFPVFLTQVFWPPVIDHFDAIFEKFRVEGFAIHPKIFKGTYHGRSFPLDYSSKEKKKFSYYSELARSIDAKNPEGGTILYELSNDKHIRGLLSFKGLPCEAGIKMVDISFDGSVNRCAGDKMGLGNIFQGTFKPLPAVLLCRAPSCPCPHDGVLYAKGMPKVVSRTLLRKMARKIRFLITNPQGR